MIQENLAGTIRCIVIDPCYQTGTAFDPRGDGAGHFILQLANLRQTTLSKGQKDSPMVGENLRQKVQVIKSLAGAFA